MARLEFKNLGHAYSGNPASLKDYALQPMNRVWEDGGAYALLGPSGCGKSTLLNIISGLLQPSEGQVLFDGRDMMARSRTGTVNTCQTSFILDSLSFIHRSLV